MSKTYTFELVVHEGNDEFWESLEHKCGADEVKEMLLSALSSVGLDEEIDAEGYNNGNISLTLKKYEQK